MTNVADKLREARKLIDRGWTQHVFSRWEADGALSFCTVGALDAVIHGTDAFNAAADYLCRAVGIKGGLFGWNDAEGRTQADVLAAFDKAIELAEAT